MGKGENKRIFKTISFSVEDEHERGLIEYATDPARGKFGPYIKRLIERDRDGWVKSVNVSPVFIAPSQEHDDEDSDAAGGFL